MAKEYGIHPAITFGVDPLADPLKGHNLLRATFYAGTAVDSRLKQTRLVQEPDAPKAQKGYHWQPTPVWTYRQAIGLDEPPDGAVDEMSDAALAERAERTRVEIDPELVDLLRGA